MFNRIQDFQTRVFRKQGLLILTLIFLLIEFFDELHYGIDGAVLPALRTDFGLTYGQVGLLLGLPHIVGSLIEPFIMLLGDTRLRKGLLISGGLALFLLLSSIARTTKFPILLIAMVINYPASGAFVSLAQASLMDMNPGRQSQAMARWTVAGSIGNLVGPLLLAIGFSQDWGWRWAYVSLSMLALALVALVVAHGINDGKQPEHSNRPTVNTLTLSIHNLGAAVSNRLLLRWIGLLQISDLLLDVFTGYAVLYFSDVVGLTAAQSSLVLALLMGTSLAADLLLIPLLERIPGRKLVRTTAGAATLIYLTWLLAPWPGVKVGLLILLRFSTIGWYQVLQGEAYASEPGRSGTVIAIGSVGSLLGGGLIWLVGWIASQAGLQVAMWLLLIGPVGLRLFVPKPESKV